MGFRFPMTEVCAQLRHNRLRGHDVDAVDAGQVHSADPLLFGSHIELRRITVRTRFLAFLFAV